MRSRVAVVVGLLLASVVTGAGSAVAAPPVHATVVRDSMDAGLAGVVGVVAVLVGAVGLVVGLARRHRQQSAARRAAERTNTAGR
jgi:hypothetical protein